MTTTLKSFKDNKICRTPIKVKTSFKTLDYQVEMAKLVKELPEVFDERQRFYDWMDSIETDIKVKGEKNVIGSF